MPISPLTVAVVGPVAAVVVALFVVLWRERASALDARIAVWSGAALGAWAVVTAVLAYRGVFRPQDLQGLPAVGIDLVLVLLVLAASLGTSASLRRLLSRQTSLIRLHLWRLEGIVFLALMVRGQVPALWALPAGIGDILVAATAPWIARNLNSPRGQRRAIIWNVLGAVDLVVAVSLGIMTSPGRLQVFATVPTSELLARFPLVLVPTFLVPLAFTLHAISLWQLLRGPQRSDLALSDGVHRAKSTHTGSSIVTGGPGTGDGIPVS